MAAVFSGAGSQLHELSSHRSGVYDWRNEVDRVSEDSFSSPQGKKVEWAGVEETEGEIGDALSAADSHSVTDGEYVPLRRRINELFEDPTSSRPALYISIWFMFLIFASTLSFMVETIPSLSSHPDYGNPDNKDIWFALESFFISFFTLEYLIRWFSSSCEDFARFPFKPFNIVDFLAIAPYFVELVLSSSVDLRFIRVIRLARVFRVLKIGKKYDGTGILAQVVQASLPALLPPFFFLLIGMMFFSSLMYLCEQGTYDKNTGRFYVHDIHGKRQESMFVSIPEAMWWSIVTMTTVGYGDYTPHTALGKLVNSIAMIFGVLFTAMPIAIIGNTFTLKWDEMRLRMNATKDFQKNDQLNDTSNWGPNQLKFFSFRFEDRACEKLEDFLGLPLTLGSMEAMEPLTKGELPDRFVDRKLSHDLLTNRSRIEEGVLPANQRNLAYKLYHIMRAESSKCENNTETYTLEFIAELYHVLGFAHVDPFTGVHLGFRSRAGLSILFGKGDHQKEIRSDSDLAVFALRPRKNVPLYFISNEAMTTASTENYGRIAGQLLASAQQQHIIMGGDRPRRVFTVSYRGYHMRFYSAEFQPDYLDAILRGKKPDPRHEVRISHFPPKRCLDFTTSTITGTFDFLTPSHREVAIETLMRLRRLVIRSMKDVRTHIRSIAQVHIQDDDEDRGKRSAVTFEQST
eukprot:Sspe_Gene.83925::Locus_55067_Transcript_1_1_Confidence_1.000_Length_2305::g.83925::m.83925